MAGPGFLTGRARTSTEGAFEADESASVAYGGHPNAKKGRLHSRIAEPHCVIRVIRKVASSGKHRSLHTSART